MEIKVTAPNDLSASGMESGPTTPTTFVTPMGSSDYEKQQGSLGLGHPKEAPTMIVTADMAQQMGLMNGNQSEIPTMGAHGQDVGGIQEPGHNSQG